jgi:hypothetical protein
MPSEVLRHYDELMRDGHGLPPAMCWTIIQSSSGPVTLEDVVGRLGGDPDQLEVLGLDEAYEVGPNDGWIIHLDQVGTSVTMFEANGFQGTRPEVLRALSVEARVHSAYWNVNAVSRLSYAAHGDVVTAFEGVAPRWRTGSRPDALEADLTDLYEALRTPDMSFCAGMLAVVEHRTGIRLDAGWFTRPHEAVMIPGLPGVD